MAYHTSILLIFQPFQRIMKEITITIIDMKKNDIKLLPGILKEASSKKSKQATHSAKHSASNKFDHIRNIDDFLQDIKLQENFKNIMSFGYNLEGNHIYTYATEENNYKVIGLLERLEIVHVEWDRFYNQKHREIGNRLITFSFYGDKALEILNRINGKNSVITKRTLRIIAQHAKDMELGDYFIELLFSARVPESLIDYSISNDDAGVAYSALLYFSSSNKNSDHKILFDIIEKLSSAYVCGGDDKALEIQNKFGDLLQHDGYNFYNKKINKGTYIKNDNNKIIMPTEMNNKKPQKTILNAELDQARKILIVITPDGKEEIAFKEKRIKRRDKRYSINPDILDENENIASETKTFKMFAIYFEKGKSVTEFNNKESLSDSMPNRQIAELLKTSITAVRGLQKRIRKIMEDNSLPIKLKTDYRGNYQLFLRITRKVGQN